jgi:hypothetical protein
MDRMAPGGPTIRSGQRPSWRRLMLLAALATVLSLSGCVITSGLPANPSTGDPSAACGAGGQLVPLRVVQAGESTLPLVEVSVQGQGPFLFALDTGASSSVVDLDVATRIGLPRSGTTRDVTGVIGEQTVPLAEVASWRLGDVELAPARVALVDLPGPDQGPGLVGLLGSDVLSRFGCVVVDYANQQLELPPATGATT